ncbi:Uncharacterised protein [Mycobacterium tuberculosis]|nr:Uncharacterised protein [Mycobacterium tuberculosis]
MTVVHTSTSTSPARKAAIAASLSSADNRPCMSANRNSASSAERNRENRPSAVADGRTPP